MSSLAGRLQQRLSLRLQHWRNNRAVIRLAHQVNASSPVHELATRSVKREMPDPIAFFNASTRLTGISLNAAFSFLAGLGMQMAGVPVVHFACSSGMSRCVLGTDRDDFSKPPPCKPCIAQARALFSAALTIPFSYKEDPQLAGQLSDRSLDELCTFETPFTAGGDDSASLSIPLGQLVLPSMRWVLRRHHLEDDEPTRFLFRQYILSASHLARAFSGFLDKTQPQAVVLFNGQFFPEATARWVSLRRSLRTITHEVGLQPYSAFFTTGEATAYPLNVPDDFELSEAQNQRLDEYLSQRFQGQFSMAGIRFWSEMKGLSTDFIQRAEGYKQVVPIFTNVIFDTSQPHSNVIFPHMFAWLDLLLGIIRKHPETLFVLRAHPDEARPGKTSQESVSQWVTQNQAETLPNLIFLTPDQSLSSYELIQHSKFVLVYNSTIGLEASILGIPVISAGRARYTQLPTVSFPDTQAEYSQTVESFLVSDRITVPAEFRRNARRFLYYQLFRSSLPFSDYLQEDGIWPGFVKLKDFPPQALNPSASPAIRAITRGILENSNFLLEADL